MESTAEVWVPSRKEQLIEASLHCSGIYTCHCTALAISWVTLKAFRMMQDAKTRLTIVKDSSKAKSFAEMPRQYIISSEAKCYVRCAQHSTLVFRTKGKLKASRASHSETTTGYILRL